MSNTLFTDTVDKKVVGMEEDFRGIFEQTLSSFLDRAVQVKYDGPSVFEFKALKAALPGEIVFATLVATEGGRERFSLL